MRELLKKFISDTSGNVVVMTAVTLPALLIGVGVAITISDAESRKITLQNHADLMSLAITKREVANDSIGASQYFNEYSRTQLAPTEECQYEVTKFPTTAVVSCSGNLDSFMPGVFNQKMVNYSVSSTATSSAAKVHEVSFVFDISNSMVGQELEDLRDSLGTLTGSDLFDAEDSRISFIPFANTVRLDDRFEKFVTPFTGYNASGGVYNGCFDRVATDANIDLKSNSTFPLVTTALKNGRIVCPYKSMTAVFHQKPDAWEIKGIRSNLQISFGTAMSDGLVWGFRSLDPSMRGIVSSDFKYPLEVTEKTSKHLIMMTDGRPYDRPWTGPGGGAVTQALSLARFKATCEALDFEAKNINFHLINYNNNKLSNEHIEVFENCVSGEGLFHNVQGGNLDAVIATIAEQASPLRISR